MFAALGTFLSLLSIGGKVLGDFEKKRYLDRNRLAFLEQLDTTRRALDLNYSNELKRLSDYYTTATDTFAALLASRGISTSSNVVSQFNKAAQYEVGEARKAINSTYSNQIATLDQQRSNYMSSYNQNMDNLTMDMTIGVIPDILDLGGFISKNNGTGNAVDIPFEDHIDNLIKGFGVSMNAQNYQKYNAKRSLLGLLGSGFYSPEEAFARYWNEGL